MDELLRREEILWRDKAKERWMEEGDANTHFFHLTTLIHRRYNSINGILNEHNIWLHDRRQISAAFEEYFVKLFTTVQPNFPADFHDQFQPQISSKMNQALLVTPTHDEIQSALFSMGSFKSP